MGNQASKHPKFKRPQKFNYTKNFDWIKIEQPQSKPVRIMSWNVLAESYKSGHAKNFD